MTRFYPRSQFPVNSLWQLQVFGSSFWPWLIPTTFLLNPSFFSASPQTQLTQSGTQILSVYLLSLSSVCDCRPLEPPPSLFQSRQQ